MKKFMNVKLLMVLFACFTLFCSCSKIKEAATTDITVSGEMYVELKDIPVVTGTTRGEVSNHFSVENAVIKLEDFNLSEEILKYRNNIESVRVGSETSIVVTTTDKEGTVVEKFVFKASSIRYVIEVDRYELGTTYTNPNLLSFAEASLEQLFKTGELKISTSGNTDITSGETLNVRLTIKNIVLKASAI